MSDEFIEAFISNPTTYLRGKEIEYRKNEENRYLKKAHYAYLKTRRQDIYDNLWTTDIHGNIQPLSDDFQREFLLTKLVELEAEHNIRQPKTPIRNINTEKIRKIASRKYKKLSLKVFPKVPEKDFLVRYSKRKYLREAFDEGKIRIQPASSYKDPSLNFAQYDEELQHYSVSSNKRITFETIILDESNGSKKISTPTFLELFQYMNIPNFYVLCCSTRFNYRLFHSFDADAALIIFDKNEFLSRVNSAVSEKMSLSNFKNGKIGYYDPYKIDKSDLIPYFIKHFRYMYQDEYRLAWEVSSQVDDLQYAMAQTFQISGKESNNSLQNSSEVRNSIQNFSQSQLQTLDINIGSMRDIAEFVELKSV